MARIGLNARTEGINHSKHHVPVCAVGRAKRIVDEHIPEAREALAECLHLLCRALGRAAVLIHDAALDVRTLEARQTSSSG